MYDSFVCFFHILFEFQLRFSHYSGYGGTFKFEKIFEQNQIENISDILVIDASMGKNFSGIRDLNKAYVGFINTTRNLISTGNWGCGVRRLKKNIFLPVFVNLMPASNSDRFTSQEKKFDKSEIVH